MGYLPMVKSVSAINHSGIRRDCAHLSGECQLLVVLTEDGDFCSLNRKILV